jgi:hypothetical protein
MKLSDIFEIDLTAKQYGVDVKSLYIEQIPTTIFFVLIGFTSEMVIVGVPKTELADSASTLLGALFSSLTMTNIFLFVTCLLLFMASCFKSCLLISKDDNCKMHHMISNLASKGLGSFFIPIGTLGLSMAIIMWMALWQLPLDKTSALEITSSGSKELTYASLVIVSFPLLIVFVKNLISSPKKPLPSLLITLFCGFLFLLSIFGLIK